MWRLRVCDNDKSESLATEGEWGGGEWLTVSGWGASEVVRGDERQEEWAGRVLHWGQEWASPPLSTPTTTAPSSKSWLWWRLEAGASGRTLGMISSGAANYYLRDVPRGSLTSLKEEREERNENIPSIKDLLEKYQRFDNPVWARVTKRNSSYLQTSPQLLPSPHPHLLSSPF